MLCWVIMLLLFWWWGAAALRAWSILLIEVKAEETELQGCWRVEPQSGEVEEGEWIVLST